MSQPSPEGWFHDTATKFVVAQVLYHLNGAGVIAALAKGPATAAELARALKLEPKLLAGLLNYASRVDPIIGRDAAERFTITDFGRRALERYSRRDGDKVEYNFFDVRVGGYGPVWAGLGDLLSGKAVYGKDLNRTGAGAARGLYRSAGGLLPALKSAVGTAEVAVEVGVDTGLLSRLLEERAGIEGVGVDLNSDELGAAKAAAGKSTVRWTKGDFFEPGGWVGTAKPGKLLVFTLHLHEFAAAGTGRVVAALKALGKARPGTRFVAFEQPLLPDSARASLSEADWLYAQSNVLIHELVGKGRVLPEADWLELLRSAGGRDVAATPTGYLGYKTFSATLG